MTRSFERERRNGRYAARWSWCAQGPVGRRPFVGVARTKTPNHVADTSTTLMYTHTHTVRTTQSPVMSVCLSVISCWQPVAVHYILYGEIRKSPRHTHAHYNSYAAPNRGTHYYRARRTITINNIVVTRCDCVFLLLLLLLLPLQRVGDRPVCLSVFIGTLSALSANNSSRVTAQLPR